MKPSGADIDPTRCPLCGNANGCGMAAGNETCWCFAQSVPEQALERVPEHARRVACICSNCARQGMEPSAPHPSPVGRGGIEK